VSAGRSLAEVGRHLRATLGLPGLMIGACSVVSSGFGLYVLAVDYGRPRQAAHAVVQGLVANWVRLPDHRGLTLADYADQWAVAPPDERGVAGAMLQGVVKQLGNELDRQGQRFPLVQVVALDVVPDGAVPLAGWRAPLAGVPAGPPETVQWLPLAAGGPTPMGLRVAYRVAPALDAAGRQLETSYHRLLLALLGLSGFPLLCLGYMILHAQALSERVARESAQEATLDLADRTCHELGNGVFVLANEGRNLAEHLDLVERFVAEGPAARDAAARRAGVDADLAARWQHALRREFAARGIDPDLELRSSAALARHVCRQIAACSEYIGLTVRELDGFLKRSALPVNLERVDVGGCLDEALALLKPRLDAAGAAVVRRGGGAATAYARADRRLLLHALVNLVKNGAEAVSASGRSPEIVTTVGVEARTVWVAVADNGPGVPKEDQARVFQDGFSTKGLGRGRGLSIVRESVLVQHGRIELVDRPDADGAEFRIGLPAADPAPARGVTPNGPRGR